MFQGLKELRLRNWARPDFDPSSVGDVILTHAHIDHSGYLPRLVRDGFRGQIYCTPATAELTRVLLLDAAKLQEEDADYANRKGFSKHHPALPLFTEEDTLRALRQIRKVRYGTWTEIGPSVRFRLHNAGHILGAAFVEVKIKQEGGDVTLVFSGDLGGYGLPLHIDPEPPPACDVMVIESTYGDRLRDRTPLIEQIREPFNSTIAKKGIILIPAFAVARVQLLVLMLSSLMEMGELPEIPIHIDSPMAAEATNIYRRYVGSGNLNPAITTESWSRVFPQRVRIHRTVDESRRLNGFDGPRIIIAPSGMMTGGRVLHHLRRLLPDEKNLVVLAGYQAPGTRGDRLQRGERTLRMHGQDIPVRAKTLSLNGLSAHADADELMRWIRSAPALPRTVFVTHGEPSASAALSNRIERELEVSACVPAMGDRFDLS
jgi:metallo-beta-lactamase family protein